jgi:hypothetical protein
MRPAASRWAGHAARESNATMRIGTGMSNGTEGGAARAGEWLVAAQSRLRQDVAGQTVEYPGRLATCPRGHVRVLPTRFSRAEFKLSCEECRRAYVFREPTL